MKMINSDIEVVSVGIGSTFDPENGKHESGVLIVTLKDEWGTSVSVHLECGIKNVGSKSCVTNSNMKESTKKCLNSMGATEKN
jgi:hypothetical protein